jgi:hypothetical protein
LQRKYKLERIEAAKKYPLVDNPMYTQYGIENVLYIYLICPDCGAMVANSETHDEWHERLDNGTV